jgi:hypothetical protein
MPLTHNQSSDFFASTAPAKVPVYGGFVASDKPPEFGAKHRLAAIFDSAGTASISKLLPPRSPLAVFWAVIAAVVLSFNTVLSAGPPPHIRNEMLERVTPASAYHNSTSTIPPVVRVLRVVAPLNHRGPAIVLRCMAKAVRCGSLAVKAATALGISVAQRVQCGDHHVSAIASAPKKAMAVASFNELNDRKPVVPLPGNIHSLGSPNILSVAAARLHLAGFQQSCWRDFILPAIAFTKPCRMVPSKTNVFNRNQSTKATTGYISHYPHLTSSVVHSAL